MTAHQSKLNLENKSIDKQTVLRGYCGSTTTQCLGSCSCLQFDFWQHLLLEIGRRNHWHFAMSLCVSQGDHRPQHENHTNQ